jgi:heme/copper-type cytochrome/quinol oxidase subunit 2
LWCRYLQPPAIVIIHKPWNKFIILYVVLAVLFVCVVWYLVWRYRKYNETLERHEVGAPHWIEMV